MTDLKERWKNHLADAEKKEQRFSDPAMRDTPEAKAHYRKIGAIVFLLGIAVAVGSFIGLMITGRMYVVFLTIVILFVPLGLWMVITGKQPKWLIRLNKRMKDKQR